MKKLFCLFMLTLSISVHASGPEEIVGIEKVEIVRNGSSSAKFQICIYTKIGGYGESKKCSELVDANSTELKTIDTLISNSKSYIKANIVRPQFPGPMIDVIVSDPHVDGEVFPKNFQVSVLKERFNDPKYNSNLQK